MNMNEHIVVIGGYGHVGQRICRELGDLYPGKVVAAGRNLERADKFSRTTGRKVQPLQLNISEHVDPDVLNNVKLIVMCLDQTDPHFVRLCLDKGIHYVDISANISFLSQVEQLHSAAMNNHATVALSVGPLIEVHADSKYFCSSVRQDVIRNRHVCCKNRCTRKKESKRCEGGMLSTRR